MIKRIYKDIAEVLTGRLGSAVRHIDLWNEQVAFIGEETPFDFPAVFVQFGQIDWRAVGGASPRWVGECSVSLHIVDRWPGPSAVGSPDMDDALKVFDLAGSIHRVLEGLYGEDYDGLRLASSLVNHNHEDIIENIEVYRTKLYRGL